MAVGSTVVEGCVKGVEGVIILITPVGKLLGMVVATVVEVGFGSSGFWTVVGIKDILNPVNEELFISVLPKVYS
jgi:hypothetical protein